MRYVSIYSAKPGMRLAYDLYDSYGRNLISANSVLTDTYLLRLMQLGIDGIYIDDELSEGIEIDEMISPKLRAEGLRGVRERNVERCKEVATKIVKEMLKKGSCTLDMADLRTFDDYTYAHSVHVAIIACNIGLGFKMSETDLTNLVLAGLLHDLGKLEIPTEILNKPSRLTQDEYMLIKTHAQLSYDFIKERIDISAVVKQAVLYHHENIDGSGYPTGVTSEHLSLTTRILHVADVYDALVSQRPYKHPFSPGESIEYLFANTGTMFDREVLQTFIQAVPLYPKGTCLTLSDNSDVIVVDNSGARNQRPLVRTPDRKLIDLSSKEYQDLVIIPPTNTAISLTESETERAHMVTELQRKTVLFISEQVNEIDVFKEKFSYVYDVNGLKFIKLFDLYTKKNGIPDIIIIDVDMKDQDGYEATKSILSQLPYKVPTIIVSASRDVQVVKQYRDLSISRYILKPYSLQYIKAELHQLLFKELL